MNTYFKNDWQDIIGNEFKKEYFKKIKSYLTLEYNKNTIYPSWQDIFNALHFTPYQDVKVVILGQDPYHGPNQAHGLSFSVQTDVTIPPSLRNIFKELNTDLKCNIPNNGYLKKWANQGVLMLNAVLTVKAGSPSSHSKIGWQNFTDAIIKQLNNRIDPVVFILWGNYAKSKKDYITGDRHLIIESPHPSPFSAHRGFFGSQPFSRTNEFLIELGKQPIDWQIEDI